MGLHQCQWSNPEGYEWMNRVNEKKSLLEPQQNNAQQSHVQTLWSIRWLSLARWWHKGDIINNRRRPLKWEAWLHEMTKHTIPATITAKAVAIYDHFVTIGSVGGCILSFPRKRNSNKQGAVQYNFAIYTGRQWPKQNICQPWHP